MYLREKKNGGKDCTFCPNPYNPCRSKSHLLRRFLLEDKENPSAQELNIANASEQSRGTEREVRRTRVSHGPVQIPPPLYTHPPTHMSLSAPHHRLHHGTERSTRLPKWEADQEVCQILCHLASTAPRLRLA